MQQSGRGGRRRAATGFEAFIYLIYFQLQFPLYVTNNGSFAAAYEGIYEGYLVAAIPLPNEIILLFFEYLFT